MASRALNICKSKELFPPVPPNSPYIQIVHVHDCHWSTVSNIDISNGQQFSDAIMIYVTLNWSTHVMEVSKKARSQLGIISRNFYQHSNNATLRQLYLSYIRPHLEVAAMVWDPHQFGLIKFLEKVQKFALRMATRNWNLDYDLEDVIFKPYKVEGTT